MSKKHTLIVGGTRGMGFALVKNLAEKGEIVSVIGRQQTSKFGFNSANVNFWAFDLLNQDKTSQVLNNIIAKSGKLNNLVFFQRYRGTESNWDGEIGVSITATKSIIEGLVNLFSDGKENSIVILSSLASDFVAEEQPLSYHVAKAALNQMVRYYAVLLGPKGIRVNSISPGIVLKEENKEYYSKNANMTNLYKSITPLGRMCTSEDVVNLIEFLCSKKSLFITGQNFVVDGGASLQLQQSLANKLMFPKNSK